MALGGGAQYARVTLVILNTLFLLLGFVLIGIGLWLVIDNDALRLLRFGISVLTTADLVWGAAVIIICISSLVIFISIFGFCGALLPKSACLGCYSGLLVVILILQAVALILSGTFYSQIDAKMSNNLNESLQHRYGVSKYNGSTNGWNFVQFELSCCGVKSSIDWKTSWWKNQTSKNVPEQCCVPKSTSKNFNHPDPVDPVKCQEAAYDDKYPNRTSYINSKGCETKTMDWMDSYFGFIIGFLLALFMVQVLIVILACCLKRKVDEKVAYEPM